MRFSAIISAGGRAGEVLALPLGVQEKCAAVVGEHPMVQYSVEAAFGAGARDAVVVGGDEVRAALGNGRWKFAEPGSNPVESARSGASMLPLEADILFLPGDIPLVRAAHVSYFLESLRPKTDVWLAAGTSYDRALEMTYGTPDGMQFMTLHPGKHAGGGLFAASRLGFHRAVEILSELSVDRKSQIRMVLRFGPLAVLRYFAGLMTVEAAERAGARIFGCPAQIVTGCAPETVLDVDTVTDLEFVLGVLRYYPTTGASSST